LAPKSKKKRFFFFSLFFRHSSASSKATEETKKLQEEVRGLKRGLGRSRNEAERGKWYLERIEGLMRLEGVEEELVKRIMTQSRLPLQLELQMAGRAEDKEEVLCKALLQPPLRLWLEGPDAAIKSNFAVRVRVKQGRTYVEGAVGGDRLRVLEWKEGEKCPSCEFSTLSFLKPSEGGLPFVLIFQLLQNGVITDPPVELCCSQEFFVVKTKKK
jgi:hypothetical protein